MTPSAARCRTCGGPLGTDDAFCGGCGAAIRRAGSRWPVASIVVALVGAGAVGYFARGSGKQATQTPQAPGGVGREAATAARPSAAAPTAPPVAPSPRAPLVPSPAVRAPEVRAPEVRAPEVRAPEVRAPEVQIPVVPAPEVRTPEVPVPRAPDPAPAKPAEPPSSAPRAPDAAVPPSRPGAWIWGPQSDSGDAPYWVAIKALEPATSRANFELVRGRGRLGRGFALVLSGASEERVPHVFPARIDDEGESHAKQLVLRAETLRQLLPGERLQVLPVAQMRQEDFDSLPPWSRAVLPGGFLLGDGPESAVRLRTLGRALEAYAREVGHYPPAVVHGPDGRPWHSWRALILRHLGHDHAATRYDMNSPWDSPTNHPLLEHVPTVYAHPSDDGPHSRGCVVVAVVGVEGGLVARSMPASDRGEYGAVGTAPWSLGSKVESGSRRGDIPLLGRVDLGAAFPWTEPRDVPLHPTKGEVEADLHLFEMGVPAPDRLLGLFLFGDGHLEGLPGPEPDSLHGLLAAAAGRSPGRDAAPPRVVIPAYHHIVFETVAGEALARFVGPDEAARPAGRDAAPAPVKR